MRATRILRNTRAGLGGSGVPPFVPPFWDVDLFASQASYDASPSAGKTLLTQAVAQSLGIGNQVATTNPPGTVTRVDGTLGYGAHNLLPGSSDLTSGWAVEGSLTRTVVAGPGSPFSTATRITNLGASGAAAVYRTDGGAPIRAVKLRKRGGTATTIAVSSAGGSLSKFNVDFPSLPLDTWVDCYVGAPYCTSANVGDVTSLGMYLYTTGGTADVEIAVCTVQYGGGFAGWVTTTSAAVYAPRISFDRGAGQNLLTYSQDFDNAAWTKTRSSLSANATTAPDGSLTADKLVEDSTAGASHPVSCAFTSTTGVTYTLSVYAKAGERSIVGLTFDTITAWFNLSTGRVGTVEAGITASITPAGGGWYRCTTTRTVASGGATTVALYQSTTDNVTAYNGDGTSGLYLWGAQLQPGALTPYLRTFASALTTAGTPRSQNLATGSGTQSVTVVPGCVYTVIHQAGGTYTLSGAGSGTTTAAVATTVVAATSTLTLTVTSAPTLLQVYEGTATLAYVVGPYSEYPQAGLLREVGRTNLALWCRDLTNAAWTASSVTVAKTATGIDGVANSASTLTASGANGTVLQAITSASAARITSAYVRRKTGTGAINMTQDNGTTWTVISPTAAWMPLAIPSATAANPTIGFRIVTSGDAIEVDYVQHELGAFVTSPIPTTTASVARDADLIRPPTTWINDTAQTTLVEYVPSKSPPGDPMAVLARGNGLVSYMSTNYIGIGDSTNSGIISNTVASGIPTRVTTRYSSGGIGASLNGGAVATGSFDGTMGTSAATVGLGDDGAGGNGFTGLITRISIATRAANDADLQAASAGTK